MRQAAILTGGSRDLAMSMAAFNQMNSAPSQQLQKSEHFVYKAPENVSKTYDEHHVENERDEMDEDSPPTSFMATSAKPKRQNSLSATSGSTVGGSAPKADNISVEQQPVSIANSAVSSTFLQSTSSNFAHPAPLATMVKPRNVQGWI